MVSEEVINILSEDFVLQLANLNLFIQAIGGIILFYIIFSLINLYLNRKKKKQLRNMDENLFEIKKLLQKQNQLLSKKRIKGKR